MSRVEPDDSRTETTDIDWNSIPESDASPRVPAPGPHLTHWFLTRDKHRAQTEAGIRGIAQGAIDQFASHPAVSAQPALQTFISGLAQALFAAYAADVSAAMDLLNCDLELAAMPGGKEGAVPVFGIRCVDAEQEIDRAATQALARRVFERVYAESGSVPATMYLSMQEAPAQNSGDPSDPGGQYRAFAKLVAPEGDPRAFDLAACFEGAGGGDRLEVGTLLWAYIVRNWGTLRSGRLVF